MKYEQPATEACLSVCTVTNGDAFSITTPITSPAADAAAAAVTNAATAVADAQTNVDAAVDGGDQDAIDAANEALATAEANLVEAQTTAAAATAAAAALSAVGTSVIVNDVTTANCQYDFLLIGGGRDATRVEADRYCGNALNPAVAGSATSIQVCSKLPFDLKLKLWHILFWIQYRVTAPIKPFKMTYRTDSTEAAVLAGTNILPAPADTLNVGFCLDYQQK